MASTDPPRGLLSAKETLAAEAEVAQELARWQEQQQRAAAGKGRAASVASDAAAIAKLAVKLKKKIENQVKPATGAGIPAQRTEQRERPTKASAQHQKTVREDALKKAGFHAKRILQEARAGIEKGSDELEEQWCGLDAAVGAFARAGGELDDPRLKNLMPGLLECLGADEEPSDGLRVVLGLEPLARAGREGEVSLLAKAARIAAGGKSDGGGSVVLIGGTPRVHVQRAIEEGLLLRRLNWLDSRPHQSTAPFEAAIARPDVTLVLVAIRWSSHSFAADVPAMCARYAKRCVRLPAGLGVLRVARCVVEQAG